MRAEQSGGSGSGERRLDGEVDRALRRLFEPPRDLDHVLARALHEGGERWTTSSRARGPSKRLSFLVLVGAAAAVVALAALAGLFRSSPFEPAPAQKIAQRALSAGLIELPPLAECLPAVGPLQASADPGAILAPDLERLYREVAECEQAAVPSQMACGAEDRLDHTLAATYGEHVRLKPSAAGMLHGPYSSKEWPTGTVLAGFPEATTAVLVAERDATLSCCLAPELAPESGLKSFTWRVGDLVLTEITPLEQPQLLDYFESF